MTNIGVVKIVHKSPAFPKIALPNGAWVGLVTFDDLPEGWTSFGAELDGDELPATKPKDIRSRWARLGKTPVDYTKRTGLVVGTGVWSAIVPAAWEYVSKGDLPIRLELYQNGPLWSVHTVIATAVNPSAYAASRLTIGDDS